MRHLKEDLCQELDGAMERHLRRKNCKTGGSASDAGLTDEAKIERVMKESLDRIVYVINKSFSRLHKTEVRFGFLLDIKTLCYGTDDYDDLKKKQHKEI